MEPWPKLRAAARGPSERYAQELPRRDARALTAGHRVGPAPGRIQRRVGRGRSGGAAQTCAARERGVVFDADGRVSAACVLRELPAPGKRSRADDEAPPSEALPQGADSGRARDGDAPHPRGARRGQDVLTVGGAAAARGYAAVIGGRGCRRRTPRCATWWGAAASS